MKISKKEYRDKQNQATGLVIQILLGIIIIALQIHELYEKGFNGLEILEVLIVIVWPAIIVFSFIRWRKLEKEIQHLNVDES